MVRAILEGRKTQTRRIIKPKGKKITVDPLLASISISHLHDVHWKDVAINNYAPYKIGDRLWVRETWQTGANGFVYKADFENPKAALCQWRPSIHMPKKACRITLGVKSIGIERIKDISEEDAKAEGVERPLGPPIHGMFRCIGPNDTSPPDYQPALGEFDPHRYSFCLLWNSIYEKQGYGWTANPWVWVIKFDLI